MRRPSGIDGRPASAEAQTEHARTKRRPSEYVIERSVVIAAELGYITILMDGVT
jgi:hypothetical protein